MKKSSSKAPKGPKGSKSRDGDATSRIRDSRFAKFETDPRYRLPSRRKMKTTLDSRFAHVLEDEEYTRTTQVDRYGRKLQSDKKKRALERLYRVDKEEEEEEGEDEEDEDKVSVDDDDEVQKELQRVEKYDPARGGGFSDSDSDSDSDSASDSDSTSDNGQDDRGTSKAADTQRFREEEAEVPMGEVTNRIAVVNLDWDHIKARDLMAMFASFLPQGSSGRIERISIYPSEFGKERMQREELEGPPREIFAGKKRGDSDEDSDSDSEKEEDDDDDESDDEKVKKELLREEDDTEVDSNALRSYQLDRLRYFYAVMVCSDEATAEAIYRATDGHEYQASSNFIDLRFVPDDVTFDDEAHDECTEVPGREYKPVEFVTEALQHSKVKLTWDQHPEDASRKDLMKKAFSGTPAELIENDLRAYLASDSEKEEDEEGDEDEEEDEEGEEEDEKEEDEKEDEKENKKDKKEDKKEKTEAKLSKKELARQKMRAALGLSAESKSKKSGGKREEAVGNMQITFTPALSESSSKKKGEDEEETSIEKYKRKEKERKERKRQRALARREGRDPGEVAESDDEDEKDEDSKEKAGEDLGFDDPFFTEDPTMASFESGPSKSAIRKEERLKKRAAREAEEKEKAIGRAQLEAILAKEEGAATEHFDLRAIMKAEKDKKKDKKKKGKKKRQAEDGDEDEDREGPNGYKVDTADPRFGAVFDDPEFAIDPSNPRYKATPGMQQVLAEVRRKRHNDEEEEEEGGTAHKKARRAKEAKEVKGATDKRRAGKTGEQERVAGRDQELTSLVNALKRKAKKV